MRGGVAVLLLSLLTGCFNPDDIFPVHGRLASPAGVEGQAVRLLRGAPRAGAFTCKAETPFKETTAAADGTFSFDVFRAQAQSLSGIGGFPFCFRLETRFASGTEAWTELQVIGGPLTVPVLEDWTPGLAFEDGGLRFTPVALDPPDASVQELVLHRATLRTDDGGVIWRADDVLIDLETGEPVRRGIALEDVVLEDFSGTLSLSARRTLIEEDEGLFGGGAFTFEWKAGETLALSGSRAPLSRGLSCQPFTATCPVTDGALERVAPESGTTSVQLALPTPMVLSTIVLRGVETEAPLMGVLLTAVDGGMLLPVQHSLPVSAWSMGQPEVFPGPRGPGPEPTDAGEPGFTFKFEPAYSVVHLDAGVEVRSVRLVFPRGLQAVQEFSVFP